MLKSTKGNLLCYQWEVERFQRSHREKMAAVAPQSNNKPASLPRHRGGPRKTAKVDAKRQNALPVAERTSRVHSAGGCQWRYVQYDVVLSTRRVCVAVWTLTRHQLPVRTYRFILRVTAEPGFSCPCMHAALPIRKKLDKSYLKCRH